MQIYFKERPEIRNGDCLFNNSKEKLKKLKEAVKTLNKKLPFIGQISLEQGKHYSGRIEKLRFYFEDGRCRCLKFSIADCDRFGQSRDNARIHEEEVDFKELDYIQSF